MLEWLSKNTRTSVNDDRFSNSRLWKWPVTGLLIIERKIEDALFATSTHISRITSITHDLDGSAAHCTLLCHVATPLLNHHQNYHWLVIRYGPPRCAGHNRHQLHVKCEVKDRQLLNIIVSAVSNHARHYCNPYMITHEPWSWGMRSLLRRVGRQTCVVNLRQKSHCAGVK